MAQEEGRAVRITGRSVLARVRPPVEALLLFGCVPGVAAAPPASAPFLAAPLPGLTEDASLVRTSHGEPPAACEELGAVEGRHGDGGRVQGSYEGAYRALRNAAAARGADLVRIDFARRPGDGADGLAFVLDGVAFRCRTAAAEGAADALGSSLAGEAGGSVRDLRDPFVSEPDDRLRPTGSPPLGIRDLKDPFHR